MAERSVLRCGIALVLIAIATAAPSPHTEATALYCHNCVDAIDDNHCNSTKLCDDQNSVCLTTILYDDSAISIQKRCARKEVCYHMEENNDENCYNVDDEFDGSCSFCCDTPGCNKFIPVFDSKHMVQDAGPNSRRTSKPRANSKATSKPQPNSKATSRPQPNSKATSRPRPNSKATSKPRPNSKATSKPNSQQTTRRTRRPTRRPATHATKPVQLNPNTAAPVTAAPATAPPATAAPSTAAPSTAAPTTAAPSTVAPSTAAPTTAAPSTAAPATAAPSTAAPVCPHGNVISIGGGNVNGILLPAMKISINLEIGGGSSCGCQQAQTSQQAKVPVTQSPAPTQSTAPPTQTTAPPTQTTPPPPPAVTQGQTLPPANFSVGSNITTLDATTATTVTSNTTLSSNVTIPPPANQTAAATKSTPSATSTIAAATTSTTSATSTTASATTSASTSSTTANSTTTTSASSTTANAKGTKCFTCSDLSCTTQHVVTCPSTEPLCMNTLTQDINGKRTFQKGCASKSVCHDEWWLKTAGLADCFLLDDQQTGPTGMKLDHCAICCTANKCNQQAVPDMSLVWVP